MTTAEMSMTTNTARACTDARLERVERALFGGISRAERLDIGGEIESRIGELLRDRCGSGCGPTREDVLAVLVRLNPPGAYLDFESGEDGRLPAFEGPVRRARAEIRRDEPVEITQVDRRACAGCHLGDAGPDGLSDHAVRGFLTGNAGRELRKLYISRRCDRSNSNWPGFGCRFRNRHMGLLSIRKSRPSRVGS